MRQEFFNAAVLKHIESVRAADSESLPVIISFEKPVHRQEFFAASSAPTSLIDRFQLAVPDHVKNALTVAAATARRPKELPSINAVSVSLPVGMLAALSDKGDTLGLRLGGIELDYQIRTSLNQVRPKVGVDFARTVGLTGRGVRVAVVDTGISRTHVDLKDRVVDSADFSGEGPGDLNGHGTHVAGIVAGTGSASAGKYAGIAPEAELLDVKVLGSAGGGSASNLVSGLEWAVAHKAQVVNISIQGPVSSGEDAMTRAVNWVVAQGVLACVAAGNQGPDTGTITSPGAASDALTVGAVTLNDVVTDFSSRGGSEPGQDHKPDLVLPGIVVSCRTPGLSFPNIIDEQYRLEQGTSQATPIASGFCALLLQTKPELTPQQLKSLLTTSSIDLRVSRADQGFGRGDIQRAMTAAGIGTTSTSPPAVIVLGPLSVEVKLAPDSIGRVRLALTNSSATRVTSVTAVLSIEDQDVFVITPVGDYDNLEPGETDSAVYLVELGSVAAREIEFTLVARFTTSSTHRTQTVLKGKMPVTQTALDTVHDAAGPPSDSLILRVPDVLGFSPDQVKQLEQKFASQLVEATRGSKTAIAAAAKQKVAAKVTDA